MDRGARWAMVHGVEEWDTTELTKQAALCIKWPKDRRFSFSITPSNEYLRLISLRIYWFDLLAVQVTLKSLLQHHNSNYSALSVFYGPALTSVHDFGKTMALIEWTFVGKVMSLLFNTLGLS